MNTADLNILIRPLCCKDGGGARSSMLRNEKVRNVKPPTPKPVKQASKGSSGGGEVEPRGRDVCEQISGHAVFVRIKKQPNKSLGEIRWAENKL